MRAAAVLLVVVYHFWPDRVPGGFVGVDVFFVVSGFLITSHLLTGFDRDGRVSLPAFWARRARRLLPASLLVLAVCAIGTLVLIPAVQWQQIFREIAASALYVENWNLAAASVDYLAADNLPSPVQHFWSLSVEEQFYLTVPVLLVLAAALARRTATTLRRRVFLAVALGLVAVTSFSYSVILTAQQPALAYFVTPTRAWEFAAGGLLSFAAGWMAARHPGIRASIAWLGWVFVVASGFVISDATPFPGIAAVLPVTGTLLVIGAGRASVSWAPDRLLAIPPVVFVGDVSYSVYLWHWPALIFAQSIFGLGLPAWGKVLMIVGVLVLSWATTRFIENPVRHGRFLVSRRPLVTFAATGIAMAVVAVPAGIGWGASRYAATASLEMAAEQVAADPCLGAGSRDPALDCVPVAYDRLVPAPSAAIDDKSAAYDQGCISGIGLTGVPLCTAGVPDGDVRVLLIGDSHVVHWLPAVQAISAERNWSVSTLFKSACSYSTEVDLAPPQSRVDACRAWNTSVAALLADSEPYDLVLVSNSVIASRFTSDAAGIRGYRDAWRALTDRGAEVVVIRDTPRVLETTGACLVLNEPDSEPCDVPENETTLARDLMVEAARGQMHVHVIDLTDYFCWDETCHTAIGGVVAYRDPGHITATLATTFGPVIGRMLDELGLP